MTGSLALVPLIAAASALGAEHLGPGPGVFFVAPDGRDTYSGALPAVNADRSDGPFRTLARAREAVRAEGMDIESLKRDFGRDLTFHGSIDTQQTLPHGSVADVEREVRSRLELFAEDGGFICCGSQDYMIDIPAENLLAIYEECGSLAQ